MRMLIRQEDTMIAVESATATINFQDILDAASVVHDNHGDAPWDNCDGFDHITRRATFADRDMEPRGICWSQSDRERIVIELKPAADCGLYEYLRARGASKQVATETVANQRRKTLDQLVTWYENGWEWFGVKCDFEILGKEYSDSIWGIDNYKCAEKEVASEIASEVAAQLEADGFTVIGQPDNSSAKTEYKRERVKCGLSLGTWKD